MPLSGAARTRDAGVEGEDDDDDDWVVVRAPARRDDDDGEVSSEVADDEAEDGDGDGDGDVNVETMDEDEGADARGKREMDAMDAMAETADAETARTIPPLPGEDAALVAEYYAQFQVRMELDRARLARRAAVREDEAVSANDDDDDDDDESEDSSSQTEFGEESDAEDDDAEAPNERLRPPIDASQRATGGSFVALFLFARAGLRACRARPLDGDGVAMCGSVSACARVVQTPNEPSRARSYSHIRSDSVGAPDFA